MTSAGWLDGGAASPLKEQENQPPDLQEPSAVAAAAPRGFAPRASRALRVPRPPDVALGSQSGWPRGLALCEGGRVSPDAPTSTFPVLLELGTGTLVLGLSPDEIADQLGVPRDEHSFVKTTVLQAEVTFTVLPRRG